MPISAENTSGKVDRELPYGLNIATKESEVTHLLALERHKRRVQLMGIVNRTPDSFFDGGCYLEDKAARTRVTQLIHEGADIIDIGAESTRPGAPKVPANEQIKRLGTLVAFVVAQGAIASVDTTSADVASYALEQGAGIVNSVSLDTAASLAPAVARHRAALVLTHCRGDMTKMAGFSEYRADAYDDLIKEVADEWQSAADAAIAAGLSADALIFDPGLGFTKNATQSLTLCVHLAELKERLNCRILVGPSRKSYIGHTVASALGTDIPPADERLGGSVAAALDLARRGADILRVHDVAAIRQALAYDGALMDHEHASADALSRGETSV